MAGCSSQKTELDRALHVIFDLKGTCIYIDTALSVIC